MVTSSWKRHLPREHGAWGMFLIPQILGVVVAGRGDARLALLLPAVLFLYLARYPLVLWARSQRSLAESLRWFSLWLAPGMLLFGLLLFQYRLWLLLPWAALALVFLGGHLYLTGRRRERRALGELWGIGGLTMTAPVAYYVARGSVGEGPLLWLLCFLYFGLSVFYVKMKVGALAQKRNPFGWRERALLGRGVMGYQTGALLVVAILSSLRVAPPLAPIAFLPITFQALWGVVNLKGELNIKRLGWIQVGHSLLFALLLATAFSLG